jgi:DNA-binding response OmpR family regulator
MKPKTGNLIFIVDDDPDDRQIILDAFVKNNAELDFVFVDSAEDLLHRLHIMESEFPNLIILDLNMPGIMGLQALKEIRSNKKFSQIPIVILTTSTLNNDRKISYELGASCFLTKPDSFSTMIAYANAMITLWL